MANKFKISALLAFCGVADADGAETDMLANKSSVAAVVVVVTGAEKLSKSSA